MLKKRSAVACGLAAFVVSCGIYFLLGRHLTGEMRRMLDLEVYRSAGEAARNHSRLYDLRFTAGLLPFTYPPFAALAFAPLSLISFAGLKDPVALASIASLLATAWITLRALGRSRTAETFALAAAVCAVGLWLEPVQQTLRLGQVNAVLMLLVVADLSRARDSRWSGVGVGLATGFKLTPAIFVLYLVVRHRHAAAVRAVGTFATTVALGFVILPSDARHFWLDRVFLDSSRVGSADYVANQSLHGVIARIVGTGTGGTLIWVSVAIINLGAGMWTAVRLAESYGEIFGVMACALTGLLVSPISWSHHWVYVVPALAVGVHCALRIRNGSVVAALGLLLLLFFAWPARFQPGEPHVPGGLIWLPSGTAGGDYHWTLGEAVLGNADLIAGCCIFVGLALLALSPRLSRAAVATAG